MERPIPFRQSGREEQNRSNGTQRHVVGSPGGIAGMAILLSFGEMATLLAIWRRYCPLSAQYGLADALVGAIALMIGVPTAWLTAGYRFPGSRVFPLLLVLPLAARLMCSAMFMRICLITPAVQSSLRALLGLSSLPPIRSLPGAALVIAFAVYPYIFCWRG